MSETTVQPRRRRPIFRGLVYLFATLLLLAIIAAGAGVYLFYHYGRSLPDHQQLAEYEPPTVTRIHAGDGRLLAEYANEKRVFVPLSAMPRQLIQAFLAAEDRNFYEHFGVDPVSVAGAVIKNLGNMGGDRRLIGASTITQQVAKNFLLTNEASFARKIKEAILAIRIEKAFSKDRILELYLNEIYLGFRSYGVAAAALNYFSKSLDDLSLAEMAYLAALPKAPNNYHPLRKYDAALIRRNWVIDRMVVNDFVEADAGEVAKLVPLRVISRAPEEFFVSEYFSEEVRRWLIGRYGENGLYEGGLSVRTTLDPHLQNVADNVLRRGLVAYDRRHGWRGPLGNLGDSEDTLSALKAFEAPPSPPEWRIAAVAGVSAAELVIDMLDGSSGAIPLEELSWARRFSDDGKPGAKVEAAGDVAQIGDVVFVEPMAELTGHFHLRQIVEIEGALVALDPHNGRVLAMAGGFDYHRSQFNRATQASRQPGSAFKPFVYLAAMDNGFTPASVVLDAPIVIDQGPGLATWKPENYSQKFYGLSTLRLGLEKSRNLMTIRIAQRLGIEVLAEYAARFGIDDDLPRTPAASLGAGETRLINLTAAYAMLVNGGRRIEPAMVERIQDRNGKTLYRRDPRACSTCPATAPSSYSPPVLLDTRERVADPLSAYQVVSMLEGVVRRGTGRIVRDVGRPLGGKTGTTNDYRDGWFVGFSPDLAVGVFVGYDTPRSLGRRESGGRVAAPIFRDFMAEGLAGTPAIPFRVPPGIRFVRIDGRTGGAPGAESNSVIVEAFKPGTEPVLDGDTRGGRPVSKENLSDPVSRDGLGGLY
jgi:penicillin-binding protein 1A